MLPSNVNIKSFKESFLGHNRLDAEFYQSKYEQVVNEIISKRHDFLGNLVSIRQNTEALVYSNSVNDNGVPVLQVADCNNLFESGLGLGTPSKRLSYEFSKQNLDIVQNLKPTRGSVLFVKDGSLKKIGTACVITKDAGFITSNSILQFVIKEQAKETKIKFPEYLMYVLNSQEVQMQIERKWGCEEKQGQLHLSIPEIENIVIPLADDDTQKRIANTIKTTLSLQEQAEELVKSLCL